MKNLRRLARPSARRATLLVTILYLAAAVTLTAQTSAGGQEGAEMDWLRNGFYQAVENPDLIAGLERRVQQTYGNDWKTYTPAVAGYHASIVGVRAKYTRGLGAKLRHVTDAIAIFDALVASYPDHAEIRFLRYSFNHQIPRFFRTRHLVPVDLDAMISILQTREASEIPPHVRRNIISFVLETRPPSDQQRQMFRRLLDAIPEE